MWLVAYKDRNCRMYDGYVVNEIQLTADESQARKFTLPADAECWIDTFAGGDREQHEVVKMETTE